jgi:Host cell surface-exposed lipoprotein
LLRNLTEQPEFVRAELGDLPDLPPHSSPYSAARYASDTTQQASSAADSASTLELGAERRNALAKAREYLQYTAFSMQGLVNQLVVSESFSEEDSTFAAANVGADWGEQATKKAREYLEQMAFSETGLVNQLVFDGFTSAESELAAGSIGADWTEQATKKAREYLSLGSFSQHGLTRQLMFDGFSPSDAEAAATAAF